MAAEVGCRSRSSASGSGPSGLAALGSLPLAALTDRVGRRRVMLGCTALRLAVTALAALSPSHWWFVALFALGRPLLAGTNASSWGDRGRGDPQPRPGQGHRPSDGRLGWRDRPRRGRAGEAGSALSWRSLFGLTLIPLVALPLLSRRLEEPDRLERIRGARGRGRILGRAPAALRKRSG